MSEFRASGTVTLLTDFGLEDPFVGIMKGVMLREHSALRFIDVSHAVPPQDIRLGDLWLAQSYRWFAPGCVHLCVVDPGVGSDRAALAVRAGGHHFVAPDNGVLSSVLRAEPHAEARRIEPERLGIAEISRTFQGRDVFAPIAARLASDKLSFEAIGPLWQPVLLPEQPPSQTDDELSGRVIAVDHFGNLITNLPGRWLSPAHTRVELAGRALRVVASYSEAELGECVGLLSSFETLEIAQRNGHAARALGLARDAQVRVVRAERSP